MHILLNPTRSKAINLFECYCSYLRSRSVVTRCFRLNSGTDKEEKREQQKGEVEREVAAKYI